MTAGSEEFAPAGKAVSPEQVVLAADRVQRIYPNGVQALEDVRLAIGQREFVSLIGPSGCGKSTLLRLFAGLETASAGHVRWWGRNRMPTPGDQSDRRFSMVFQEATLMPWSTVANNVSLPLELAGESRGNARARVDAALATVGLSAFADAYPRELSGGMQMRAAIARALVTDPNLLLMDEPFGALDEFNRNRLDDELRALWARRDLTVVFVTHSIYEAVFLSTRVVVMAARPGRIIADVAIDAAVPRDDAFRVSAGFIETCQQLSELLAKANASGAASGTRP